MVVDDLLVQVVLVLVTAAVTYVGGRWDERRRRKQDTTAIRTALGLEIASNLRELEALWAHVDGEGYRRGDPRVASEAVRQPIRFALHPAPRWRRSVWEAQLPEVADALGADEVEAVDRFYAGLARFDILREKLGQPWMSLANTLNFSQDNLRAWLELRELIVDLRREGNPLARYRVP